MARLSVILALLFTSAFVAASPLAIRSETEAKTVPVPSTSPEAEGRVDAMWLRVDLSDEDA
ncbi:hypothetical protein FA15DRAFT_675591 [Coprinopsis marcescibilis]|uniref:Uncharacterized protein n=1 Tax=Coprinopsis marcescibilis TaxID=230819 RepID=A0A5C3KD65_COPMA|nr:hypothetical protein FA15DRAFT_675591 [Coprinopsis marcescibilis]